MKKYGDFSEDNAFFENEIAQLSSTKAILPVDEDKENGSGEDRRERSVRLFSLTVMMTVAAAAVLCILIFLVVNRETEPTLPPETDSESEEWRGAFLDRGIYEQCAKASVSVREGRYAGERVWSGFVLSEDGWIATSSHSVGKADRGRIYVTLHDGEEYPVESLVCYGELALLKISAQLSAVTLRESEVQNGEALIGVRRGTDVLSGEISNAQTYKINMALDQGGEGAPLFDGEGRLVGMAYFEDGQSDAYALSAEQIKKVFFGAKEK